MESLSPELLSRYADGEASPEEARRVERALESDPALAAQLEELRAVDELMGLGREEVPEELRERLHALRPVPELQTFEPVRVAPVRRFPWRSVAAALAAAVLVAIGIFQLTHRPRVPVRMLARQELDARDAVLRTDLREEMAFRSGDALRTGERERLSFYLEDGTQVVLRPGTAIRLADPSTGSLFHVETGTVLCTVRRGPRPRMIEAGGVPLYANGARFGVRVEGRAVRTAGPAGTEPVRVTVAVSRGAVDVRAERSERVTSNRCLVLEEGRAVRHTLIWKDSLHELLLREFGRSRELLPGYYRSEGYVAPVSPERWLPQDGKLVLPVHDGDDALASYLVLHVRATEPGAIRLTRITPMEGGARARTATILTEPVGTDWQVLSIPLSRFDGPDARRGERALGPNRGRLRRLEVSAADEGVSIHLHSSLWAARPPAASRR